MGMPAKIEVSLDRPARTTSAPSSRARRKGSVPIMPTMWLARSITSSLMGGAGFSGRISPWRSFLLRYSLSCSAWMRARRKWRPSSWAISPSTSAVHSRLRSAPAVPEEPMSKGMLVERAAWSISFMSRFTAWRGNMHLPRPKASGPWSVDPASEPMKWGSHSIARTRDVSR